MNLDILISITLDLAKISFMKKFILLILLVSAVKSQAQFKAFYGALTWHVGGGKLNNTVFEKTFSTSMNGEPQIEFSNMEEARFRTMAFGVSPMVFTKNVFFACDVNFPLKRKTSNTTANIANVFNAELGFGGYLGKVIGLFVGGSFRNYGGQVTYTHDKFQGFTNTSWAPMDYRTSGKFAVNKLARDHFGLDGNLFIAFNEHLMFRVGFALLTPPASTEKAGWNDNQEGYSGKSGGGSRFETGLYFSAGDGIGFFAKFTSMNWKFGGTYSGDETANLSKGEIELFPESMGYSLKYLTIGLSIPLSSESRGTTVITLAK